MSIVSTEWLSKNHSNVKVIDSSWHMPNSGRNGFQEYNKEHIENSIFFDIDKNSNKKNKLPHMLPEHQEWNKIVSNFGISNSDKIYKSKLNLPSLLSLHPSCLHPSCLHPSCLHPSFLHP